MAFGEGRFGEMLKQKGQPDSPHNSTVAKSAFSSSDSLLGHFVYANGTIRTLHFSSLLLYHLISCLDHE